MPPDQVPTSEGTPKQDATGTLLNQSSTTPETKPPEAKPEPKPEPKAEAKAEPEAKPEEKSLLNQKDAADDTVPEKYSPFTLPEGFEANEEAMTEASGIFKELGLSQTKAQKLVDFYAKVSTQAAASFADFAAEQQKKWVGEVKADPEIGGKLGQVKATVSKMLDGLGDSKLTGAFREAMDYTGAGNNPAFIRVLYRLAQKLTEGGHVSGGVPARDAYGKLASGNRSAAQAMYPNLPSGG